MINLDWLITGGVILIGILLIGVLVIWKTLEDRKSGFPARDERTLRVTGKAATYTFYIGSYFMLALMLANILNREFLGVYLLDAGYALVFSVLVESDVHWITFVL